MRSTVAAIRLASIDAEEAATITHKEFYTLLRYVNSPLGFAPVRRTYDAMISTGEIEIIPDAELKRELASFFSLVVIIEGMLENLNLLRSLVLDPYFAKNLDFSALMHATHPEVSDISLSRGTDQFRDLIGNEEFEGTVMTKWHMSYDLTRMYKTAMDHIDAIDRRIQNITSDRPAI